MRFFQVLALTGQAWWRYRWALGTCGTVSCAYCMLGQILPAKSGGSGSPSQFRSHSSRLSGSYLRVCAFSFIGGRALESRDDLSGAVLLLPMATSRWSFGP